MSDMHAETALWIDGLRKRADRSEQRIAAAPEGRRETVDAHDRLRDLRNRLDDAGRDPAHPENDRSSLEKMFDDLDAAITRAIARM
jgi:hypothetical protein